MRMDCLLFVMPLAEELQVSEGLQRRAHTKRSKSKTGTAPMGLSSMGRAVKSRPTGLRTRRPQSSHRTASGLARLHQHPDAAAGARRLEMAWHIGRISSFFLGTILRSVKASLIMGHLGSQFSLPIQADLLDRAQNSFFESFTSF